MTRGATVAVHGGRFGDLILEGLRAMIPDVVFVAAASEEAVHDADVLATLADGEAEITKALTPRIEWIHVLGAGVDGFPFVVVGGRKLTCSRGAAAPAIAEFVMASMLAFEKQLPDSWITEPPEQWNVAGLGGLSGKTLGLVGIGAIGSEIAKRAVAFEMDVLCLRRREALPDVEGVRLAADVSSLVEASDHVVVAAPATARTVRMFDSAVFAKTRRGAHFVNVARGSLVDQDALLEALDSGQLAMATLDVVEPEPLPAGHPLYSHPKVRLSPHISWSSPATAARTLKLFEENLTRYRRGEELHFLIDVREGY